MEPHEQRFMAREHMQGWKAGLCVLADDRLCMGSQIVFMRPWFGSLEVPKPTPSLLIRMKEFTGLVWHLRCEVQSFVYSLLVIEQQLRGEPVAEEAGVPLTGFCKHMLDTGTEAYEEGLKAVCFSSCYYGRIQDWC